MGMFAQVTKCVVTLSLGVAVNLTVFLLLCIILLLHYTLHPAIDEHC